MNRDVTKINEQLPKVAGPMAGTPTWLGGVGPAPLGSHTVVPSRVGVLDEPPNVFEEFAERHLAGLIDSVVKEGRPP